MYMTTHIHPTAVVDLKAHLGKDVKIGPYCIVGEHVSLGDGVELKSHVVVDGRTTIGANTVIFPFASIGMQPQDLKYRGEPSELIIGKNTTIREGVTMNTGTEGGGMLTRIGDNCLFMAGSHVAHDCILGNNVILANNATLAGHVTVGDFAILGGLSAVHQHVRIGHHAMIGGMAGIGSDVIPYGLVAVEGDALSGLNLVGLKRRGFERDTIQTLRSAYRLLFAAEGTLSERIEDVSKRFEDKPVAEIVEFLRGAGPRAVCQPKGITAKGEVNAG